MQNATTFPEASWRVCVWPPSRKDVATPSDPVEPSWLAKKGTFSISRWFVMRGPCSFLWHEVFFLHRLEMT